MVTKFSEDLKELACMVNDATTIECILKEYVEKESLQTFGFLIALMAFPAIVPFTPPGIGTMFGVNIILLSIAIMANSSLDQVIIKIPKKIRDRKVGTSLIKFINASSKIVNKIEFFIKPRFDKIYKILVIDARHFICILLILLGILMSMPITGTNTIPAIISFIIGMGIMNKDGFLVLTGAIVGSFVILAAPLLIGGLIVHIF